MATVQDTQVYWNIFARYSILKVAKKHCQGLFDLSKLQYCSPLCDVVLSLPQQRR